jgi:medium-chain acyl-[acyl-carrier-protein] hydrolase
MTNPDASGSSGRWLPVLRPVEEPDLRLFCFPYAGGSAVVFSSWPDSLPRTIDVRPVQLPGRGARLQEPAIARAADVVSALAPALLPLLDRPFAFFCHSMGALLAFETTRWLRRHGMRPPRHLYVSGRRAPHVPDEDFPPADASDAAIVSWLREMNGTPPEVLENEALMTLLLPSLRADIRICGTYAYEAEPSVPCPITVFGGVDDEESAPGYLEGWGQHATGGCTVLTFPGDHFFLHSAQASVLAALTASLRDLLGRRRPSIPGHAGSHGDIKTAQ